MVEPTLYFMLEIFEIYICLCVYNNVGGDFAILNENCKNPVVFSADRVEGVCASFVFSGRVPSCFKSESEIRFLLR